ncbi:single-stranded DNA binding protein [Halosegnis sp.]|uniref:single-stranded DNA binding protein n=1 Tax=Halosegnis sp. TaxID=2864959 RepID=UPI0035D4E7EB
MSDIEEVYADLDADVSLEEFREAVEAKVEQMGGLADEETAAMLIAHELTEGEVEGIADIEPGMEEVKFLGKVVSVGEVRTFEREGEDDDGQVCNIELADETGRVRVALWDEDAAAAQDELAPGQVLRIAGRPKEGYNGLEVSADRVEGNQEATIDVDVGDDSAIDALTIGQSDVNLVGRVLDTDEVRTFSRDDGSEGRVANLTLGDETGRVRVTLWDEQADRADELSAGVSVEVIDGYVREREGDLELHVGDRGAVEEIDEDVTYVPETTDIDAVEMGETVDIAGVVRSADPKRTFDRDDGSEGQVRNVRVQDDTGDIRVALWGDKADLDVAPGDELLCADVEIQDGWQDELEASAGWRSTVSMLDDGATAATDPASDRGSSEQGLDAFAAPDDRADASTGATDGSSTSTSTGGSTTSADGSGSDAATTGLREFTGTVVQTGDPVMLDDGEEAVTVATSEDVKLGQEVTVRGEMRDGTLHAEELF